MKKALSFLIVFLLSFCVSVNAEDIELSNGTILKENFKTQFDKKLSGFLLNIKETDDGFVAINLEEVAHESLNYAIKFDKEGNILYKSVEDNYFRSGGSDIIQTKDDYILTTDEMANSKNIRIYDSSLNIINKYDRGYDYSSTQNIYEYGDNYAIIGSTLCNDYNENCIYINIVDSKGNLLETKSLETNILSEYNTIGIYSENQSIYYLYSNKEGLKLSIVDKDYNVTIKDIENSNNYELSGLFTNFLKYNNDFYFAGTTGVYKIDSNYNLTKVYDGEENNIDITSMIINEDYIVVGGISPYGFVPAKTEKLYVYLDDDSLTSDNDVINYLTEKYINTGEYDYIYSYNIENRQACVAKYDDEHKTNSIIKILDSNFNELQTINVNEVFGIEYGDDQNITKTLAATSCGFVAGGMLNHSAYAIEYCLEKPQEGEEVKTIVADVSEENPNTSATTPIILILGSILGISTGLVIINKKKYFKKYN